jgi:hypothetical protein
MRTSERVLGFIILAATYCIAEANAKGGSYQTDDVYNPQHVTRFRPKSAPTCTRAARNPARFTTSPNIATICVV